MKRLTRKRRTRQHVIADLSVNHVERHALLAGFVVEQLAHDYGVDLKLMTFNRKGEIEEGEILVQLKATDRLKLRPLQTAFSFRVDRRDLVRWLAEPMPVILIVYDARKDLAHWLYIQSYLSRLKDFNIFAAGKTVTIRMPTKNVVDPDVMRRFALFRDLVLKQISEVRHDER